MAGISGRATIKMPIYSRPIQENTWSAFLLSQDRLLRVVVSAGPAPYLHRPSRPRCRSIGTFDRFYKTPHPRYNDGGFLKANFGGFIPLSTVDWRGRATCTVFLRGCPVRCRYCQNVALQEGRDERDIAEILAMIRDSTLLATGVVFSGGEATMQKDVLVALARGAKEMDLGVGLQTNGVFPETIRALLAERLVDKISLDIKTRWSHYRNLFTVDYADRVKASLALCTEAHKNGTLPEFEVVVTVFRGCEDDVPYIAKETEGVDLVLQQGIVRGVPPLTFRELAGIADRIRRAVKIRTREDGEVIYEGRRIMRAESITMSGIEQERSI